MKRQITLFFVLAVSVFSRTLSAQTTVTTPLLIDRSGRSFAGTHPKDPKTSSIEKENSVPTGCQLSFNIGMSDASNSLYAQSYDTLQAFIQTCPTNVNAPGAFGILSHDVHGGGNGPAPGCYPPFKQWLLSAFAWNPGSAEYFCADVGALEGALGTDSEYDTSWAEVNTASNKTMSVMYWLIHNPPCNDSGSEYFYVNGRLSQKENYLNWPELNRDSIPLDTTIYSMHDLGLDSVLKYAGLLGVNNNTPSIISNASAYPNPAGTGTVISFGVAREAYVSINLYDVLGHQVSSAGFGAVVEPGNLSVPMSLVGLPPGTYFARIQTTYGEAQTVKFVKE